MPTAIEVLEEIIADKFRHRATGSDLVLEESAQKEYRLHAGVKQFALRIDLPPEKGGLDVAFPFLKTDVARLTCKCDLIVFVPDELKNRLLIFLVEMKSLNAQKSEIQMLSSREFARYLVGLMKLHGLGNFEPEYRGVLIRTRRTPSKATTRQRDIQFENRGGLDVYECDRSRPLSLRDLMQAA